MTGRYLHKFALFLAMALMAVTTQSAFCQDGDPGGGGGDGGQAGGVEIDADGVLSSRALFDYSGALDRQRAEAAKSLLAGDLQNKTDMRWIAINRLEAQAAALIEAGQPLPDEMKYLAGMTRITHVFYFPESKDIVIGGPAEPFFRNSQNRVIGTETGAATLKLEDLVVALRTFAPGERRGLISVSIDPTQEGLARMKQTYAEIASRIRPGVRLNASQIARAFADSLGLHTVTVKGISPNTHMAQVLVDADYHMKLIGIGIEKPPVRITSFIQKATPQSVARGTLQRWFFQPDYDCVRISADKTSMQLVNGGVKLVGEDESIARDGSRANTGKSNKASRAFCDSFTQKYDELAEVAPLYADMRNIMDLSIAAAFIQQMDFYGKSGWKMNTFGDESKFAVETYKAPKHVKPVVNAVWKGNKLMTPIGGGVVIQPRRAFQSGSIQQDSEGSIQRLKDAVSLDELGENQWWWN